jgi:hypothetical protein
VKTNLVDVLRRELDKPSWTCDQVAVGTATDPYQPIEGHYRLTRGSLEALAAARARLSGSSPRGQWSSAIATCCSNCRAAPAARST